MTDSTLATYETLALTLDPRGIAHLVLNRPEKHNAMNAQMIDELHDAAKLLSDDERVRAVVLSANGKTFCAGGDLGWMQDQAKKDRAGKIAGARKLADMLFALNILPKPLIAKVHSNAFGGGVGLMAVCDITIVAEGAKFGLTETKLGLIPATIGPFVVDRMGSAFARQVFFTAKSFDTDFALRSGLASKISNNLDDDIETELSAILQTKSGAVASAKALCQKLSGSITQETIEETIEALADRWESEEARDGIAAFFERRAN
ncbi:crotonase/enoyl-CoA hydratase family protein [Ahrensia sp. 13_GOM-1096m]|uniref:crotonase/enoyl-CoA hydratase family protein n=1 Tax=Ahrensia sp. 13_GOM-1096m TaxID=1380380 RepID=UPI00047EEE3B|nr:crotonase/enoyl-CoA hydratase family protein [Ahrensia sp. 13_GOM-1096m]